MKKIAIVSTYKIDCGIARFTETLESSFNKNDIQVTVFPLNRNELKQSFGGTQKSAKVFIEKLTEELKNFDAVSIQYEYSLLSDSIAESAERLLDITKANPNTTITFHTIINKGLRPPSSSALKNLATLKIKKAITQHIQHIRSARPFNIELSLFKKLNTLKSKFIVHTNASQNLLTNNFKLTKVFSHPLSYTNQQDKEKYPHSICRNKLLNKLGLPESSYLIGVFGFLGGYKGFEYAIETLGLLGSNYKLVICGGLHPSAIKHGNLNDVSNLIKKVQKKESNKPALSERIFFLGSLEDDEMYEAISAMDMCWLPYLEVGQEASAIASEVSELGRRVIFSRTHTFEEYRKYKMRKDTLFFEISNSEELRLKTLRYDEMTKEQLLEKTTPIQNHLELQANFYINVLLNNM